MKGLHLCLHHGGRHPNVHLWELQYVLVDRMFVTVCGVDSPPSRCAAPKSASMRRWRLLKVVLLVLCSSF